MACGSLPYHEGEFDSRKLWEINEKIDAVNL